MPPFIARLQDVPRADSQPEELRAKEVRTDLERSLRGAPWFRGVSVSEVPGYAGKWVVHVLYSGSTPPHNGPPKSRNDIPIRLIKETVRSRS